MSSQRPLTAAERGDLAARMVPTAARLAGVVRDAGGPSEVGQLIGHLTRDEMTALCVVLAAMVPDDKTPVEMLAWVDFDEEGQPLPPGVILAMLADMRPSGRRCPECDRVLAPRVRWCPHCHTDTRVERIVA